MNEEVRMVRIEMFVIVSSLAVVLWQNCEIMPTFTFPFQHSLPVVFIALAFS